jgi:hypothetical protein
MDTYSDDENYPPQDCDATHLCNHPHLEKNQRGWCRGKNGHTGIHRCGRCASVFARKETYTREELLHLIQIRISQYERRAKMYPSGSRQLGYKIDELLTLLTQFF